MSRQAHVKYLVMAALAGLGIVMASGSPSETPAMAATSGASAEQMQLGDAGIRDAPPRPDAGPRMDAPPPPDARSTQDALIPPPPMDAGGPRP